jgi:1,4-alpha-glucan branching enzyme
MLKKEYFKTKPNVCKVTFGLSDAINAESAYLVGDFNGWNEVRTPMKKLKTRGFTVTLELEKGHEYQFRYLVNGTEWHNDWNADKYVPNPYSGDNSVAVT